MCLVTNKKVKTAIEDIEVLKVLSNSLLSPFQDFQYILDFEYRTKLTTIRSVSCCCCCIIDNTYLKENFIDYENEIRKGNLDCYEQGFHSSLKLINASHLANSETKSIFKCIIPKGSTYVEDFVGFVISDKIIIKERFIMGTLLNASPDLAQNVLDNWFEIKNKITSLEFKAALRSEYPDYEWTQFFCSRFLFQQELPFDDNGTYRTYYAPDTSVVTSFEDAFNTSILELESSQTPITKKNIKKQLIVLGYNQGVNYESSDFETHFEGSDLHPTGNHNSENHNIYVRVGSGQHYSKTKNNVVTIKMMHKNHIANTLKKNYSVIKSDDYLDPNTEQYDLLQGYFTYDLLQKLKELS